MKETWQVALARREGLCGRQADLCINCREDAMKRNDPIRDAAMSTKSAT
jgi:hypothetical protein